MRPSLAATLLAIAASAAVAPLASASKTAAGVAHVRATPLFPVPASARVHSEAPKTANQTTSTPAGAGTSTSTAPQGGIPTPSASSPTTSTPTTSTPPASTPSATQPRPGTSSLSAAHAPRRTSKRLSTGAIVGAALAGALVLLCLVWALARWSAIEPRWTRSLAYSLEEASFRASTTWAELLDWARIGH